MDTKMKLAISDMLMQGYYLLGLKNVRQLDCRYSRRDKLCLLINDKDTLYLMKTKHHRAYFRKVIVDDVSGGFLYEPTGEKQETTYRFATLEDIRKDMRPLY